jgi:hypothetical protein
MLNISELPIYQAAHTWHLQEPAGSAFRQGRLRYPIVREMKIEVLRVHVLMPVLFNRVP